MVVTECGPPCGITISGVLAGPVAADDSADDAADSPVAPPVPAVAAESSAAAFLVFLGVSKMASYLTGVVLKVMTSQPISSGIVVVVEKSCCHLTPPGRPQRQRHGDTYRDTQRQRTDTRAH